jgi:hypothetical protein
MPLCRARFFCPGHPSTISEFHPFREAFRSFFIEPRQERERSYDFFISFGEGYIFRYQNNLSHIDGRVDYVFNPSFYIPSFTSVIVVFFPGEGLKAFPILDFFFFIKYYIPLI